MGELLNLVGLGAGIVLYAVLLAMVVRASRQPRASPFDPLLLGTAVLGLVWNLCALPVYELPKVGFEGPFPLLAALGFSALGFLPAVVVHSVLRGKREGVRGPAGRALALIAYSVSAVAAAMQLYSASTGGAVPSVLGMRLLTYTFVALIVPLAAATRGQPGARRALWAAALATFAVSALHLTQLHGGDASWPVELLGHHASLPLAFAILYQDYPFALADLFLKRALALIALLALAFSGILLFGQYSATFARLDPRQVGLLVTLWVGTALLYPALRRNIAWFVDTVVLHRPDYPSLRVTAARRLQAHDEVASLLTDVCELLGPALSARHVTWREWAGGEGDEPSTIVTAGPEALALVPTSEEPRYAIAIADVTGGRRFLSDDLATLDAIVVLAARRIDAIRITNERYDREIREQEIGKLATEAELRALRAQVNPHFLFNALTTIGHLIQTAPPRALETLMRLTALLRAVLRSEGEFTTLGRELEVVEAYLDIEHARFEQRLRVRIEVPPGLSSLRVPPLVLQPIVENAVKHGIATRRLGGEVTVSASVDRSAGQSPHLVLIVRDTGAGATAEALRVGRVAGVGLNNVERRLACQYGTAASLSIRSDPDTGTTVEIRLPIERTAPVEPALQGAGR
jgi:signal transduction histidine kinase